MNVLFTGRGTSGSWKIRGQQLGTALGATVKPRATAADFKSADLVVIVKRPEPYMISLLKDLKKPWVWDVVDFYPQPACTVWPKKQAIHWVQNHIKKNKPNGVVWPNRKMAEDCSKSDNDIVLYHHCYPNIKQNKIREEVRVVGYEGSEKYLGKWHKSIKQECLKRGWEFWVNRGTPDQWDICVAFRDDGHNGYVQRHWKSNVKLANAHGSGTPFISGFEYGYFETNAGPELFCDTSAGLGSCFDALAHQKIRQSISKVFLDSKYTVDEAAKDYRTYLECLL